MERTSEHVIRGSAREISNLEKRFRFLAVPQIGYKIRQRSENSAVLRLPDSIFSNKAQSNLLSSGFWTNARSAGLVDVRTLLSQYLRQKSSGSNWGILWIYEGATVGRMSALIFVKSQWISFVRNGFPQVLYLRQIFKANVHEKSRHKIIGGIEILRRFMAKLSIEYYFMHEFSRTGSVRSKPFFYEAHDTNTQCFI